MPPPISPSAAPLAPVETTPTPGVVALGPAFGAARAGIRFYTGDLPALAARLAETPPRGRAVAVCNTHMLVTAGADPALAEAMRGAAFALCDGQPIAWLISLLTGTRTPRVTGPDLLAAMLAADFGPCRIALVGGSDEARARLAAGLPEARRRDTLILDAGRVAEGEGPSPGIVAALRAFAPRVVFVGLGCPKQEKWMALASRVVPATFIGVGAAFDYTTGRLRRAPRAMQVMGCEWLYRMSQQPRLIPRYAATFGPFALIFARGLGAAFFARRAGRPAPAAAFELRQP